MQPRFPGSDIISEGIEDLECGRESIASLLVSIGAPRLQKHYQHLPKVFDAPEHRLYRLLARSDSVTAHTRYNAWVRRLVSFERAIECGRGLP